MGTCRQRLVRSATAARGDRLHPYFRPVAFGSAIVVVDAIAWYEATSTLIRHLDHVPDLDQQLARAAVDRLITADRLARPEAGALEQGNAYLPFVDLIGV